MEFYQLKITRKGTKPPVWRRCLVPADTDFAKLAAMLEDILEYADTENYEFEFFQKKLRLQNLEAQTAEATKGSYEYAEAKGRQIAELLDTEAWFTFRVKGMELPDYRTDIEKIITDEEKAGTPEILKETKRAEDDFWTADMQTKNTELEKKYTKDEILEFYLNNIYFGNGYYGIQAASRGYFDTDVSFLSLSQMAYLCAIQNNPTMYNPYKNPDNTLVRRVRILKNMNEDGKISRREYKDARQETIVLSTAEPT